MILTREQFDVLVALALSSSALDQSVLAKLTGYDCRTISQITDELVSKKYIENYNITEEGLAALEPYRVKRAIFIAAGFGKRLIPITLNTPKPLVRVHGIRIIDRLIDACLSAGINEIYIVRGYLGELFDQLSYT